jgi:hypothetical protein
MAVLLVKDRDATHPDHVKDASGCYKRGDVVEVYDDDKPLQVPPAPPFVLVRIMGLSKAKAQQLLAPVMAEQIGADGFALVKTRRRAVNLAWADLPLAVRTKLATERYYETTLDAVRAFIRDKATGKAVVV